jgi:hypothetical protein
VTLTVAGAELGATGGDAVGDAAEVGAPGFTIGIDAFGELLPPPLQAARQSATRIIATPGSDFMTLVGDRVLPQSTYKLVKVKCFRARIRLGMCCQ